jgi:hypothetical protein
MIKRKEGVTVFRPWNENDPERSDLISVIVTRKQTIEEKEGEIEKLKAPLKDAKDQLEAAIVQISKGKEVPGYEIIDEEKRTVKIYDEDDNLIIERTAADRDIEPQAFDENC